MGLTRQMSNNYRFTTLYTHVYPSSVATVIILHKIKLNSPQQLSEKIRIIV